MKWANIDINHFVVLRWKTFGIIYQTKQVITLKWDIRVDKLHHLRLRKWCLRLQKKTTDRKFFVLVQSIFLFGKRRQNRFTFWIMPFLLLWGPERRTNAFKLSFRLGLVDSWIKAHTLLSTRWFSLRLSHIFSAD